MSMIKEEKKYRITKPKDIKKTYLKEKELLLDCRAYLKSLGVFFRRVEGSGKLFAGGLVASEMKGFPDLLIVNEGQLYCAELKCYGGHLTASQAVTIVGLLRAGARAGIVLSRDGLRMFLSDIEPDSVIKTDVGEVPVWQ